MGNLSTTAFGVLLGTTVTLVTQKISESWRIWFCSYRIRATPDKADNVYRVRVCNRGKQSIEQAVAYISVNFDNKRDIVDGEESAFIHTGVDTQLVEDRLCWSTASHPVRIDIYPGEKQALDLVMFEKDKIQIPSEQGWFDPENNHRARVFLRNDRYEGSLHIVSKNTLRRSFKLVIDASSNMPAIKLTPQRFGICPGFLMSS